MQCADATSARHNFVQEHDVFIGHQWLLDMQSIAARIHADEWDMLMTSHEKLT